YRHVVVRTWREAEPAVDHATLRRDRWPAHVQRARAVHRHVAGVRRQRDTRQIEPVDTQQWDVGTVRARDRAELAVLATRAGHRDTNGEPATAATVPTERAVLVPAHIREALDHTDLLVQTLRRVADVGTTLDERIVGERTDRAEPSAAQELPERRRLLVEAQN